MLLFIDNDVRKDQHLRLADILSNTIQKRLSEMTDPGATEASLKMRTLRSKAVPKALASTPKVLVDCSEEDIANQLTLMEFAIYSSIKVRPRQANSPRTQNALHTSQYTNAAINCLNTHTHTAPEHIHTHHSDLLSLTLPRSRRRCSVSAGPSRSCTTGRRT